MKHPVEMMSAHAETLRRELGAAAVLSLAIGIPNFPDDELAAFEGKAANVEPVIESAIGLINRLESESGRKPFVRQLNLWPSHN